MCKTKRKTDALDPKPITDTATNNPSLPSTTRPSTTDSTESTRRNSSNTYSSSTTSTTSRSPLRHSLPQNPNIYTFSEISSATNNFLSDRLSSSSWRCSLRHADAVVRPWNFRRPIAPPQLHHLLLRICKSHHISVVRLLGAAVSDDHIYLVYDHIRGVNLSDCLKNPKNPNFTVLSTWISRMQIAINVAQGLEYIHHYTGLDLHLVHNHIKTTSIIVTEPSFNAKICDFGAAVLAGEVPDDDPKQLQRSDSRARKVEGTRGYMPPENPTVCNVSQKSDVFAFGVVMLELLSGEEALRYRYDEKRKDRYERVSVVERAREAVESGKVRQWIDSRLRDSFPVNIAERMTRVALDCVQVEPDQRPDMRRVAGKISKLYLQSKAWSERMAVPTGISVSFAPR